MRLNRYIATYSDLSRRKADELIESGLVIVNRKRAYMGMEVDHDDVVIIDKKKLIPVKRSDVTIMLNKPVGFVSSKDGQGSPTIYDLLPKQYQNLNIAGRLDKDSSGLMILTSNGNLVQELSHPSNNKEKVYEATLKNSLTPKEYKLLTEGVDIGDDRPSKLGLVKISDKKYTVTLQEGRKRQIRRSFEAIGNKVESLHRTQLGDYSLDGLRPEQYIGV